MLLRHRRYHDDRIADEIPRDEKVANALAHCVCRFAGHLQVTAEVTHHAIFPNLHSLRIFRLSDNSDEERIAFLDAIHIAENRSYRCPNQENEGKANSLHARFHRCGFVVSRIVFL